ncbi:MAG: peptidoglycan DD-metalloendopeptidase family protein [bacterium]
MKYILLLRLLTGLIYIKRSIWWSGRKIAEISNKSIDPIVKFFGYFFYRFEYLVGKKVGTRNGLNSKIFKRDNLQILVLLFLFFLAIPQTKLYGKTDKILPGQNTIAYSLVGNKENFGELEEVIANNSDYIESQGMQWRQGSISSGDYTATDYLQHDQELAYNVAMGGVAITKPIVFPGTIIGGAKRSDMIEHEVQLGETVSAIAFRYGVSVATILWENNLSDWSLILPGDKLNILPANGLTHKIVSGDTLIKIANLYGSTMEEIIKFNKLKKDGSDLRIGEKIMIPDGVKLYQPTQSVAVRTTPIYGDVPTPASSQSRPSASGFVWPCAMRIITQYYWWGHSALDVSGPIGQAMGSAIYASKAGTVEVSQCGWNMGYGCYIIINHGGGYKTLYGHNSKLLVNVGDYVSTGQTISLMGNTGRVYGPTGVHLHFEIIINGWRANPLGYVK